MQIKRPESHWNDQIPHQEQIAKKKTISGSWMFAGLQRESKTLIFFCVNLCFVLEHKFHLVDCKRVKQKMLPQKHPRRHCIHLSIQLIARRRRVGNHTNKLRDENEKPVGDLTFSTAQIVLNHSPCALGPSSGIWGKSYFCIFISELYIQRLGFSF